MMMQDRLKIRVWDKYEKSYWLQSTIEQNIHWLMNPEEYKDANYPPDYVDIEQCSGLKDKNDKLIYEGDIVKDEHEWKYIVKFGKHTVTIPVGYVNGETECLGWYLDNGYLSYHLNPDDDYLIIGNIHENEDLLENK